MYWAQALAQSADAELKGKFAPVAKKLTDAAEVVLKELVAVQGQRVDIGGYYNPSSEKTAKAMRPSATFNAILAEIR